MADLEFGHGILTWHTDMTHSQEELAGGGTKGQTWKRTNIAKTYQPQPELWGKLESGASGSPQHTKTTTRRSLRSSTR